MNKLFQHPYVELPSRAAPFLSSSPVAESSWHNQVTSPEYLPHDPRLTKPVRWAKSPIAPHPETGAHLLALLRPVAFIALLLILWKSAVSVSAVRILPSPWEVLDGIVNLAKQGLLLKYVVASLFRVTWGFALAAFLGIPIGLAIGWYRRAELALNPLIQIFRPISPLAWIPIAILWFGVGDAAAIFLIFLGCFFPLLLTSIHAVQSVPAVHVNAARNFGLSTPAILRRVLFPAVASQLIVGLRITLGVAWLVVVAAEMIAVNSGLGFLIADARNAGNRYDLVVAGMAVIGVVGLLLDLVMRSLQKVKSFG